MKFLAAFVVFAVLATVLASPSPFFHSRSVHRQRYAYYPLTVQRYVHVPEVHVQKVVYPAPVYVAPVHRTDLVQTVVGGSVNVAANPGAVHVTKTSPTVVTVA